MKNVLFRVTQSTSKAGIHQKKVMLSVWWDFKGIVYFELLPRNQTINSNFYCRQLMQLGREIKEKRPELATRKDVIFHQDNARPHTSLVTRKKLLELGQEVMPHPPYSPDPALSDYHLFKNELIQFFTSKNQTFYESGIMKLTERWQQVIEQNGQYIINNYGKRRNDFVANPILDLIQIKPDIIHFFRVKLVIQVYVY